MEGDSNAEIDRLRLRASGLGITILTQRANGTSERCAYSLIDHATGTVLHRDVDDLIDLDARLSAIIWDRQRARVDGTQATVALSSCPSCGTRRIGQFRWCRSCGRDFERMLHPGPQRPPSRSAELQGATPGPTGPTVPPTVQPAVPEMAQPPAPDLAPRRWRWPPLRISTRDRDSYLSAREIAIGAALGLLIGVVTTILVSTR